MSALSQTGQTEKPLGWLETQTKLLYYFLCGQTQTNIFHLIDLTSLEAGWEKTAKFGWYQTRSKFDL